MINDIKNCTTCANMNQSPKFCADCEDYSGYTPKTVIRDICRECSHNNTTDYIDCTLCNGGSHFIRNEKLDCKNCIHSKDDMFVCKDCVNYSDFKLKEDIDMSETNNRKDKIKELEEYLDKAFNLLNELKEEKVKESDEKNVLKEYNKDICNLGKLYYFIDGYNRISENEVQIDSFTTEDIYDCHNYLTEDIAEQAFKLKSFNDKLLAFKYCYDCDYVPNWKDKYEDKYYVYLFCGNKEPYFEYEPTSSYNLNQVYFSSEAIAEQCVVWLNNELKEGRIKL